MSHPGEETARGVAAGRGFGKRGNLTVTGTGR
jgi:hypothetical protein